MNNEWLVWQLADATFPAGGLAHSSGLEAASKWGELNDAHHVEDFVRDKLTQIAHTLIPPMRTAWESPDQALAMDHFCQAFINNHVANRASRAQGKAFLISAGAAFGLPVCQQMREEIQARRMHGHFPVVFGIVAAGLQIDVEQSTRLFLYIVLRGLVSSGIRLSILGPLEGQALRYRLCSFIDALSVRCRQFEPQGMAQTAPLVELFQASQDRLYSRLFQS
jgi:urease accessory protein